MIDGRSGKTSTQIDVQNVFGVGRFWDRFQMVFGCFRIVFGCFQLVFGLFRTVFMLFCMVFTPLFRFCWPRRRPGIVFVVAAVVAVTFAVVGVVIAVVI